MTFSTSIHTIEKFIDQLDIHGQYQRLAAPIRLSGSINTESLKQDLSSFQATETQQKSGQQLWQIGIDEAGRGPLLGDVVVAAAILPHSWSGEIDAQPLRQTPLAILTDSKQLSEKKRDLLYPLVKQHAIGYMVADVPAAVIDQVNILQATMIGMRLCSEQLMESLLISAADGINNDRNKENLKIQLLFDGNRCPEIDRSRFLELGVSAEQIDLEAWVKGDGRHTSIAAASILAKVSRDLGMYELAKQYPNFGIERHKGYPTKAHLQAIADHGVLPEHRRSFAPVRRALEG